MRAATSVMTLTPTRGVAGSRTRGNGGRRSRAAYGRLVVAGTKNTLDFVGRTEGTRDARRRCERALGVKELRSAVRADAAAVMQSAETIALDGLELELDSEGVERVKLREEGWKTWNWRGHACNYISAGENNTGPIVTLVHGFGAHSYHWRYTIPALARAGYRVYALCMLGYGWSPKVEEEYCMELWGQQVIDFSQQIGGATEKDKTIIVGNSIGALAALYAASTSPQSCKGLCLVNSAGNFEPDAAAGPEKKTLAQRAVGDAKDIDDKSAEKSFAAQLQEAFGRFVAAGIFYSTKFRIRQILSSVYEFEVDDDLVRSIDLAAQDPGAIKTFYQLSLAGSRTKVKAGDLLQDWTGPLMLLWGEKDPWMTPTKASRILEIKPDALYTPVIGGHCPHDDCPAASNAALLAWANRLP